VKLVVDMNLSPEWLPYLRHPGWEIRHWQDLGSPAAADDDILAWAREHRAVVFTQDLDFVQLLHGSQAHGPSVVLLRVHDELDETVRRQVAATIHGAEQALRKGALLTIKEHGARVRDLPLPAARRRKQG
jgi:predicted nuclease of predicted toxin-antitoxin system